MSLVNSSPHPRLKSVLIATDLSPSSAKPLHHALGIALHYRAKLYVAHVVSTVPYLIAGPHAQALAYEGASKSIQQLQSDLLHDDSAKSLDCEFIIRYGHIWQELHAIICQKQIDLIVLGTDARRGIEKVLLGSVAEQVYRDASCPVLTVGPHSYQDRRVDLPGEIRTYLFATDFSEASLRALPQAVSLAHQTKAKLILLHVVPAAPAAQISGGYTSSEILSMRENVRMACVRWLERLVRCDEETPIDTEFLVQFGIPSEKILQVALDKRVDLIILGLRREPLAGTISHKPWVTAYEVVCGAGCPVLTVRQ
ncbi:MAG: universal stress protein [Candidatus Sulfotelmatobacter sp.]